MVCILYCTYLTDLQKWDLIVKINGCNLKSSEYFNSTTLQKHTFQMLREHQVWWSFLRFSLLLLQLFKIISYYFSNICVALFLHSVIVNFLRSRTLPFNPHFPLFLIIFLLLLSQLSGAQMITFFFKPCLLPLHLPPAMNSTFLILTDKT